MVCWSFFAGVPNGTLAPLNLSTVYLNNTQYTGTSGLTMNDQQQVVELAEQGNLSRACSVGAIGGMQAAKEGIQAMIDGRYSGKIIIFPQIHDLPLMGLSELEREAAGYRRETGVRRYVDRRGGKSAL
jgi:hypothetical protein